MSNKLAWGLLVALVACQPKNRGPDVPVGPAQPGPPPVPLQPERLVVMDAEATGIALYPEELEQLRQTAAMFVAAQPRVPVTVVAEQELASVRASMVSQAARCRAATGWEPSVRAAFPGALQARVVADCHERPCRLSVRIERPPPGDGAWQTLADWEANVEQPESLVSWVTAVGRLVAPPPSPAGGLLGSLSQTPATPLVEITRVSTWGQWDKPLEYAGYAPLQKALDACHAPGWSSASSDRAVVGIGADGVANRCQIVTSRDPDSTARTSCLCRALEQLPIPPGSPARRVEVQLLNRPSSTVAAGDVNVGAAFDAVQGPPGYEARPALGEAVNMLAQCYAGGKPSGVKLVDAELSIDPDGSVRAANVLAGDGGDALASCIGTSLRAVGLPCPPNAAPATLRTRMRLYTVPRAH